MCFLLPVLLLGAAPNSAGELPLPVTFELSANTLSILVDSERFAVYVFDDQEIARPYFCHVVAPNGVQVTRNHPPRPETDKDNMDHATFHPGIWLAFGDLGGADFWRLRARVRHVRFAEPPGSGRAGVFSVVNVYETTETPPRALCEEVCTYTISATPQARWIMAESEFRALVPDIAFGDQEEMGLGVRIATPLTVKHGNGVIMNSLGGLDEKGTWGSAPNWCAYSGVADGRRTGILLMADPGNFRKSWYHNRNYGLMVANPFGKKSMIGPDDNDIPPDATPLPMNAAFRLGFAVCVFSENSTEHPDYDKLFQCYDSGLEKKAP